MSRFVIKNIEGVKGMEACKQLVIVSESVDIQKLQTEKRYLITCQAFSQNEGDRF